MSTDTEYPRREEKLSMGVRLSGTSKAPRKFCLLIQQKIPFSSVKSCGSPNLIEQ
jgi:hypothetical protein